MEEKSIFVQPPQQQPLPNSTAVLVLGILSLVICLIGILLGVIALVFARKDLLLYNTNPEVYSIDSYKNIKTGRTCAIIGIMLNIMLIVFNEFYRR